MSEDKIFPKPKFGITIDDKILSYHLGDSHPMNSARIFPAYHLIKEVFIDNEDVDIIVPVSVDRSILEKAHDKDYIRMMDLLSHQGEGSAMEFGLGTGGDCPVWPGMAEAAEFVVGSTVTSAERVFNSDYAITFELLGGLHHASSARASGFCYYNDINVAIQKLKQLQSDIKILYIDTDVHHGDGTQFEFFNDPNVVTISFHESGRFIFPGTGFPDEVGVNNGLGSSVNMPFYPYVWDDYYLEKFDSIVPPIFESFEPDFVIWQAGVDGHKDDILGHLQLTTNTYTALAKRIKDLAVKNMNQTRLIALGGGGYNPNSVAKSWSSIVSGLSGIKLPKVASEQWQQLCAVKGINITPELYEAKSSNDTITASELELVVNGNEQYFEELKTNLSEHFSF